MRLFRALCDPNRLVILARLAEQGAPATVSEVAATLPIDLSVVSRHLAMLRDAGILEAEKRGKEVYYSVRLGWLVGTLRGTADALAKCCPSGTVPAATRGKEKKR